MAQALKRERLRRWLPFLGWPRPDRALLATEASALWIAFQRGNAGAVGAVNARSQHRLRSDA